VAKKLSPLSNKWLDGFLYQARNASAWMMAFFVLATIVCVFLYKHFSVLEEDRRILVPYGVETLSTEIEYSGDYNSASTYLFLIAQNDAMLYANFSERNADGRAKMFLTRLSRDSYKLNKINLLNVADENMKNRINQTAFVDGAIEMSNRGRIKVPLRIERRILGVEQAPKFAYLTIKYSSETSFPLIAKFEYEEVAKLEK